MNKKYILITSMAFILPLTACQTISPAKSSVDKNSEKSQTATQEQTNNIKKWRDDSASDAIKKIYIQPAIINEGAASNLSEDDIKLVLYEVNRQLCFEATKRFEITTNPNNETTVLKTSIVKIKPTGRASSSASAVAKYFIPVPFFEVRFPIELGGLEVASELVDGANFNKIAYIEWSRNAKTIGKEAPSLSRVGDALQLSKPMASDTIKAFATNEREKRKIINPDPCANFGPRFSITGKKIIGAASGLYVPEKQRN